MINWGNVGSWMYKGAAATATVSSAVVVSGALPSGKAALIATGVAAGSAILAHELSQPDSWPQVPLTFAGAMGTIQNVAGAVAQAVPGTKAGAVAQAVAVPK